MDTDRLQNINDVLGSKQGNLLNGFQSYTSYDHFDDHWDQHFNPNIPQTKLDEARRFLAPLHELDGSNNGVSILDVGCGDGVHIPQIEVLKLENGLRVGVDISTSALKSAQKRDLEKHWEFIHADACNLPFNDASFDVTFSYGVLAYTSNPYKAFLEMLRVTKKGGLIGLWMYPKQEGLGGLVFRTIRKLCQFGGKPVISLIANSIVPFLGFLPTSSGLHLGNATWKSCREVVMVNIAPQNLWFPLSSEIMEWFDKNDISIIDNDVSQPITIWGRK